MDDTNRTLPSMFSRLRKGNEVAWEQLYRKYHPMLVGWARHRGASAQDAEEGASEVVYVLVTELRTFEYDPNRKGGFRAFLGKILRQRMHRLYDGRRKHDERNIQDSTVLNLMKDESATENLLDAMMRDDEILRMRTAIDTIREEIKEEAWLCWHLIEEQRLSGKEAADRIGISAGTLYVTKGRVATKIKTRYMEMSGEES